jgi:formiminotetrahydrofolate cyclodeaminase
MAIAVLARTILESLQNLPNTSNPNLISDLAIAAELATTAANAAAWNVRVNVPQLSDAAERTTAQTQLESTLASARVAADSIAKHIASIMKAK